MLPSSNLTFGDWTLKFSTSMAAPDQLGCGAAGQLGSGHLALVEQDQGHREGGRRGLLLSSAAREAVEERVDPQAPKRAPECPDTAQFKFCT